MQPRGISCAPFVWWVVHIIMQQQDCSATAGGRLWSTKHKRQQDCSATGRRQLAGVGHAEANSVRIARFTLQYSDAELERSYLLADFAETEMLVPLFSLVLCLLSYALIAVVPSTMVAAPYIFPMFITVGAVRFLVRFMANQEQALALYCWTWTLITFYTFLCWLDAQRRFELVTGVSIYFLLCVCVLLVVTSAHLRLLIGAILPRLTTLLIYLVGWACTWPRISVLSPPLEMAMMCGSLVLGHGLSHTMERDKRNAFLKRQLGDRAASAGVDLGKRLGSPLSRRWARPPPLYAQQHTTLGEASAPTKQETIPSRASMAMLGAAGAPGGAYGVGTMNRLTLEFSNADIEHDFLLQDFRQAGSLVVVFSFTVSALLVAFLLAFPSAWAAAPFTLPQFIVIGGVRLWVQYWDDEWYALQVFSWTWLGVSVAIFSVWLVAQRTLVLLSGLSVTCMLFISFFLCVVSCFLSMLVGAFLPRNLTLLVYLIGWGGTWPRVSVLSGALEPILTCAAIILGGLVGHTWSHTRRIVHQSAHFEVNKRVEQAMIESEKAAEDARQRTALRFAEALRYINDVVIELGLGSAEPSDVRRHVIINCSASFGATFGRESDHTPGLLFELVDPDDAAELEQLLCSASSAALSASSTALPASPAAASESAAIAFVKPDGTRRRFKLQVVRIEQPPLRPTPSMSERLSELGDDGRGSESGASSSVDPLLSPAVSLFVVCHDLSDALRQAERETEEKAHRVLNHTAKRVMANTSQCCRMAIEQLRALPLGELGESAGEPGDKPGDQSGDKPGESADGSGILTAESLRASRAVVEHVVGLLNTTLAESVTGCMAARPRPPPPPPFDCLCLPPT